MYCNIIVTRPFNQVFTYDAGVSKIKKGQIVLVPFGKSIEVGMVTESNVKKPNYKIKKIFKNFDSIFFDESTIKFIKWINNYTLAPLGSVLKLFTINNKIIQHEPPLLKKIKLKSRSHFNLEFFSKFGNRIFSQVPGGSEGQTTTESPFF